MRLDRLFGSVPWEPSPETVIRIGWTTAVLGFLIAIVSAVGEVLGWWDLLGEIGMTIGSLLGVVATFSTLTFTASRGQADRIIAEVGSVQSAVLKNGRQLEQLDKLERLDVIQLELDRQTGVLDEQLSVLGQIRDGLGGLQDPDVAPGS